MWREMSKLFGDFMKDAEYVKEAYPQFTDIVITSPPYAEQRKNQYGGIKEEDYPQWNAAQNTLGAGAGQLNFWAYNITWGSSTCDTSSAPAPSGSGISYACAWQGIQDVYKTYGGYQLKIDYSSANHNFIT